MRTILTLLTYCTILSTSVLAQKLEVTYQEVVKVNPDEFKSSINFSSNGKSSSIPKDVYDNMIKDMQEPKDFLLTVFDNETTYKKIEKIDNQQHSGGMRISISFGDSGSGLYKNLSSKEYYKSVKLMDKSYTIKDQLKDYKWQLSRETKKILGFDVRKATSIVDSTTTATAWYTPNIPVKDGPGMYDGLPGLILEVEIKNTKNKGIESNIMRAIELKEMPNLKPLEKPKDKNIISDNEYKTLMEKQMERFKQMRSEGIDKKD
ncbi:GLPGLI family protein [Empedobacter tilapiae]|uniref:GLPGLI family protein n=1 Tax=Empedobacter tilapiae TaxID=2491114 RepID=UPI0028D1E1F3|nr:GLPGLI family protein [Empedobacter tilapiae]